MKNKFGHLSCCAKLLYDPVSKVLLFKVAFLGPQKMWTVIPKIISNFVCYKRFFKNAPEGEYIIYSLVVFKHEDKLNVECTEDGPGYDQIRVLTVASAPYLRVRVPVWDPSFSYM